MDVQIITATIATLDAEEVGAEALATLLGVAPPSSWPPELNDAQTRQWMRCLIDANPLDPGFGGYYVVADGKLVGFCGFKGPPGSDAIVEIGYAIIAEEQRRGFANKAAELLIEHAAEDRRVKQIIAETLPALVASQRVLLANGFARAGQYDDPELGQVWRYARSL